MRSRNRQNLTDFLMHFPDTLYRYFYRELYLQLLLQTTVHGATFVRAILYLYWASYEFKHRIHCDFAIEHVHKGIYIIQGKVMS